MPCLWEAFGGCLPFPYLSREALDEMDEMALAYLPVFVFCEPLRWSNRYEYTIKQRGYGKLRYHYCYFFFFKLCNKLRCGTIQIPLNS